MTSIESISTTIDNIIQRANEIKVYQDHWKLIITSLNRLQHKSHDRFTTLDDFTQLLKAIDEVLAANADKVAEFRSGKDKLFGFFVGQVMKATQGKANPAALNDILMKKLKG